MVKEQTQKSVWIFQASPPGITQLCLVHWGLRRFSLALFSGQRIVALGGVAEDLLKITSEEGRGDVSSDSVAAFRFFSESSESVGQCCCCWMPVSQELPSPAAGITFHPVRWLTNRHLYAEQTSPWFRCFCVGNAQRHNSVLSHVLNLSSTRLSSTGQSSTAAQQHCSYR